MLKQIDDTIINTDSIEQIYFTDTYELLLRTNTGNETYFYVNVENDEECLKVILKLNELLHDPRVIFIDLNNF
jgi:hypothetical protein